MSSRLLLPHSFRVIGVVFLTTALALGGLTAFGLLNITPSGAPIAELPLALIPTAVVPLLFTLHITSMVTLARAPRPAHSATGPLLADATPPPAVAPRPASRAR